MPSAWFAPRPLPEELRAPPLWAMPVAAGVALLVFGIPFGTWFWFNFRAKEETYRENDRHRLAEMAVAQKAGGPGLLRVVGIGTSLLENGTLDDRAMAILGDSLGVPVRYVRISRIAGAFSNWRGTMEEVRAAGPSLVLLEDQCLFYMPRVWVIAWWQRPTFDETFVRRVKALFGAPDSPRPAAAAAPAKTAGEDAGVKSRQDSERLFKQREVRTQYLRFGLRPDAREVLQEFRKARIPVVVLRMPIHPSGQLTRAKGEGLAMERSLDALRQERLVTVLTCPLHFNAGEFSDLIHLTPEGRDRYSRWLIETLAARREHDLD